MLNIKIGETKTFTCTENPDDYYMIMVNGLTDTEENTGIYLDEMDKAFLAEDEDKYLFRVVGFVADDKTCSYTELTLRRIR